MAQTRSKSGGAAVTVHFNENENTYELRVDVGGVAVPFATVKAGVVDSAKQAAEAASESE